MFQYFILHRRNQVCSAEHQVPDRKLACHIQGKIGASGMPHHTDLIGEGRQKFICRSGIPAPVIRPDLVKQAEVVHTVTSQQRCIIWDIGIFKVRDKAGELHRGGGKPVQQQHCMAEGFLFPAKVARSGFQERRLFRDG